MLECRLYAKRKARFIGGTRDGIEFLLAEGEGGGLSIFMLNPVC